jgi:hypothetical protein
MSKYKNKTCYYNGMKFDSEYERDYWIYLTDKEKAGEISNLRRQVPYELIPAIWGEKVKHLKTKDKIVSYCIQQPTHYFADFVYVDTATGKEVVVDTKSEYTRRLADYCLKKKMMRAFKGIEITEVVLKR